MNRLLIVLCLLAMEVRAQVPVPAQDQNAPIMLVGGTAHLGTGDVIEQSVITFDNGKITYVGSSTGSPAQEGYEVISVSGKHIYPGFILPNTQTGLQEVSNIRQMNDYNEQGSVNPNTRAVIAYNTDSEYPPTFRFNGILLAETTPTGGIVSGTSSVMELDGWNWEDAALAMDIAVHMNWPSKTSRRFDQATFSIVNEPNKKYPETVEEINRLFEDARSYGALSSRTENLKLKAMQGLFTGEQTLMIHAGKPKEIVEAVKMAIKHEVKKVTLVTNASVWHVRDFLKEHAIPVILNQPHLAPSRPDDDYDLVYRLPYMLTEAGISVSLSHEGMLSRARNLPFYAGTSAAFGLPKEEALKTITSNPAKALGIFDRVGSLEVGKDATLFVSEGDALDMRGNVLLQAYISGKKITLDNKQQDLYDRYSEKYGHSR